MANGAIAILGCGHVNRVQVHSATGLVATMLSSQTGHCQWTNVGGHSVPRALCCSGSTEALRQPARTQQAMRCTASRQLNVQHPLLEKSSTATIRVGGRLWIRLVELSVATTILSQDSSARAATLCTAWIWQSAVKCGMLHGAIASGSPWIHGTGRMYMLRRLVLAPLSRASSGMGFTH